MVRHDLENVHAVGARLVVSLRTRRGGLDALKQTIVLSLMAMHRYQSGLMARSAKPLIREFKSHPMLHKIYKKYALVTQLARVTAL